jgi:hypothetical protein
MDRHDQTLLDKQMGRLIPPRHDGVIAMLIAAMFFVGLTAGLGLAEKTEPTQTASNNATIALAIPDNASQVVPR